MIILQGKDRARISNLCKNGQLMTEYGDGVTTLHEGFLRGARVSSEYINSYYNNKVRDRVYMYTGITLSLVTQFKFLGPKI